MEIHLICFMAGTMIRTPNGEVAVETLKRGDLVLTNDGRSVPVDWLGIQTVSLRFADKMRVLRSGYGLAPWRRTFPPAISWSRRIMLCWSRAP